jgi:hypothetical protein
MDDVSTAVGDFGRRTSRPPEISVVSRERHQTTVFRHAAFAEAARHAAHLPTDHHPAGERLPGECRDEGLRRGRGREGWVAKRGGIGTRMCPFNSRRSREAGVVASVRSSAADSPRPQCPPPNRDLRRFANRAVMKPNRDEIEGEASHKHGPQSSWLPQDASSGSGRSKRGPARLKQHAAAGTRIGRDSEASELRIAVCYGMPQFANQDEQEPAPGRVTAHVRDRRASFDSVL